MVKRRPERRRVCRRPPIVQLRRLLCKVSLKLNSTPIRSSKLTLMISTLVSGSICAFDSDSLLDLVDAPPAAPPPPMLPDVALTSPKVTRVMAAGGLDGLTITSALSACTDNAQTPCTALDYERPVRYTHLHHILIDRNSELNLFICCVTFAVVDV